ncbi:LLM class flavin-dependent oxidoreductase [Rhizorhabdus dicambivorans]|uniref:FMN-dependent monooxygenase n=1 Tax=Rhizorhabdus dicambivorans TaxID=1850238 RepID=A0A2A4FS76_9SPHN|nr:LLM class flavin-dependent oxidoreductase [Rhizorhabdus dicambivorans]ATE64263.1 FMN-dependent monooxygenase [Rhizorhabdus dicambivorans]PCE40556.1 FMN-dependent monooxygenase [Rhizorhabdus dicambivorans]
MSDRQMTLIAFLQAQNCSNFPASWRHPEAAQDFTSAAYYQRIGKTLEAAKIHLAFFDDRLAIPDIYGDDFRVTMREGIRAAKLDPMLCAMAMGLATERLGIGVTYSTTYYEPFHVARTFATLDSLTGGRAAWNVVTSLNQSEAVNFGRTEVLEHDLRYDRADEFIGVVRDHWRSWDDDALRMDRETGLFADPDGVRRLDHEGDWFRSRGPFTVPRSPQGEPILIQAGQSGRGKQFAAKWGDLTFVIYPNLEMGRRQYADFKSYLGSIGRDPDQTKVAPAVYAVIGESQAEAEDRYAAIQALAKPIDALVLLSEVLNFDFSTKGYDEAFSSEEMDGISGIQAFRDRVVTMSGRANPTVGDFVEFTRRGTLNEFPVFVGDAKSVADQMEEWFGTACDGFVLAASHVPGSYEDFTRMVVPELQRRGLFQTEYAGSTLRENLGLPALHV